MPPPSSGRARDFADVPTDDLPLSVLVTGPDASITIVAFRRGAGDFHDQPGEQRDDGDVLPHPPAAELAGLVGAKANEARRVRLEILSLGPKPSIGAGEEQILMNEPVERGLIRRKLSGSQLGLEGDDFVVCVALQNVG